ncbi:MAG TPA: GspMb/PilO family protein, partial [Polyangia bacterium]|nr:GspMb/PilO family protein [Polyangia bacterium]
FERLSQRERTMVTALGVTFVVMVTLIVGFLITDGLSSLGERNADMRQALKDIETQRDGYLKAKAKGAQLDARIGHQPIQLSGYLEQAAKESGVEIPESNERQATAAGKLFIERSVELRLKSVRLEALAAFLKKIETGPNLVLVTQLSVRTRDDKHQELDVEMTVSTWEHAPKEKPGATKKGDKT